MFAILLIVAAYSIYRYKPTSYEGGVYSRSSDEITLSGRTFSIKELLPYSGEEFIKKNEGWLRGEEE